MSPYLIVFLILWVFAGYEYWKNRKQEKLYWVIFIVLTAMLCLRYGQGSDYFGYMYNYLTTPKLNEIGKLFESGLHGEPGWLVMCSVLRTLNVPFPLLVTVLSGAEMFLMHRFVYKFSPLKSVSLLAAYPTLYLTFVFSALRQGLVMMVFLGYMVEWIRDRRWGRYIVVTMLCSLIHSSALAFLIPLAVMSIPERFGLFPMDTSRVLCYGGISVICGLCMSGLLMWLSPALAHYAGSSVSIMAVGERVVTTGLIILVFREELDGKRKCANPMLPVMLQVYLLGTILYGFLFWNSLISARMTICFKAIEIILLAVAMTKPGKLRRVVAIYVFGLAVLMFYKNVGSYIHQGRYFDTVNVFNYPYFSLFDQEAVESYRKINYDFSGLLP